MDDFMTKANDMFPTQTQIENLTLQPNGLNAQRVRCNKQTLCMCHTRGQEPKPHKEFTTVSNFHLISNKNAKQKKQKTKAKKNDKKQKSKNNAF